MLSNDVHTANETVLDSSNFVKMIDFVKYFHDTSKTKHNERRTQYFLLHTGMRSTYIETDVSFVTSWENSVFFHTMFPSYNKDNR